jgi:hypothetical protein
MHPVEEAAKVLLSLKKGTPPNQAEQYSNN